jgi:hypothetical protein
MLQEGIHFPEETSMWEESSLTNDVTPRGDTASENFMDSFRFVHLALKINVNMPCNFFLNSLSQLLSLQDFTVGPTL